MKLFGLCISGLLVCLLANNLSAVQIDSGSIMIESSDIVTGQIDGTRSGYDFRFSYNPNYDYSFEGNGPFGRYYVNNDSQPSFYGYEAVLYEQANTAPLVVQYYPITPTSTNVESWVIWHFDFGNAESFDTIDQLQVKLRSTVTNSPGSWILWEVSTDGTSWDEIYSLSANQFNSLFWDITEYVQGSSEYFLKATLYSSNNLSDAALFKQNDFGFDNEVWLVPEPGTMFLLATGGLAGVLIRKKRLTR